MSPGPKMVQTSLVVMAGAGVIREPFALVKSIRPQDRQGRGAVAKVNFRLPTLYNRLVDSVPVDESGEKKNFFWDPNKFRSEALARVFEQASRYAKMKTPVLIMGERGTGKTTLASWIRINSPYKKKDAKASWPSVPCGQYSPELMRSELFGHVKGAFTGAGNTDKQGLIDKADGETLFLDEIGDISVDVQRLLIRALEDGTYTPVGSDEVKKSSFRLLTATNRTWQDLQHLLGADFLDRISQLTIQMPPLRMLNEDMHWIWHSVYEKAQERSGHTKKLAKRDHEAIISVLLRSKLPGNIRDLYRVAYHVLGAAEDAPVELAVKAALHRERASVDLNGQNTAQKMAHAFAHNMPITLAEFDEDILDVKGVSKKFKRFMAEEIRAIAKRLDVKPQSLCNASERSPSDVGQRDRRRITRCSTVSAANFAEGASCCVF